MASTDYATVVAAVASRTFLNKVAIDPPVVR